MKRAVVVLVVLALAGAGWYWYRSRLVEETTLAFQGYVEGELVFVGPEEAGRLDWLAVQAGAEPKPGDTLFEMESSIQEAQRAEAVARLAQAKAQLENLRAAQSRPEQIAVLRAGVERAKAALELSRTDLERTRQLLARGIAAQARLDQAQSAFDRDTAALAEAQRQIEAAQLGGRGGEIEAAEAAVRAADAALDQAEARLAKRNVRAPAAGVVQEIYYRPGETVQAGQAVLALLPPANRKVRFYVPETRFAEATLGRKVAVACDGCPEGLVGTVSFVSRETEFTPPIIYSEQERAKLVFKIEARLGEPAAGLPLGLPVSVRFVDSAPGGP